MAFILLGKNPNENFATNHAGFAMVRGQALIGRRLRYLHLLGNVVRGGYRAVVFPARFILYRLLIRSVTSDGIAIQTPPHSANESDCHNALLFGFQAPCFSPLIIKDQLKKSQMALRL
jgi:hypothetical protein